MKPPRLTITQTADAKVTRPRIPMARLRQILVQALGDHGIHGRCALSVRYVNDATARTLHAEHFDDPTTTDVMTFPDGGYDPANGTLLLGDLAVCVDVARREAVLRKRPISDELTLYILHGVLHLLGYDDRTAPKRRIMWQRQRELLASVGIPLEAEPS